MGAGLQVWDAAGHLVMDVADPVSRLSGTASIAAGATGSVVVPNASQGSIWYAVLVNGGSQYCPVISVSGSTISWSPATILTPAVAAILLYGTY